MQRTKRARRRQPGAPRSRTHLPPHPAVPFRGTRAPHPRTAPRPPQRPPLRATPSRGLGVPAASGKGFPETRNPDRETSGQVSHGLYRQHFSLLLRTKPTLPSPRADADFKDQCSADFV